MLSNETVKANSRKLNSLPEYAYNYVCNEQYKLISARFANKEVYTSDMVAETLQQALRLLVNLRVGRSIAFYPKGEKYGKKVVGIVTEMSSKGIAVKFENNIYTPINIFNAK